MSWRTRAYKGQMGKGTWVESIFDILGTCLWYQNFYFALSYTSCTATGALARLVVGPG